MNILEKDIESLICDCLDQGGFDLATRGLFLHSNYIRQLDLGSYGRADIVTFQRFPHIPRKIYLQIVELKKDLIDSSVLHQAIGYCKGIERMLKYTHNLSNHEIIYEIILIGKEIQKSGNFCYFTDFIPNLKIYTCKINLENGIEFQPEKYFFHKNEMRGCLTKANKLYLKDKITLLMKKEEQKINEH